MARAGSKSGLELEKKDFGAGDTKAQLVRYSSLQGMISRSYISGDSI